MTTDITPEIVEQLYLADDRFPVDFDLAWRWMGYTRKENALDLLKDNFSEGADYEVLLRSEPEQRGVVGTSLLHPGVKQKSGRGGANRQIIRLTLRCFKKLAMMAGTKRGDQVRDYFLDVEDKYRQMLQVVRLQERRVLELNRLVREKEREIAEALATVAHIVEPAKEAIRKAREESAVLVKNLPVQLALPLEDAPSTRATLPIGWNLMA